jgi:hypothetical protein
MGYIYNGDHIYIYNGIIEYLKTNMEQKAMKNWGKQTTFG